MTFLVFVDLPISLMPFLVMRTAAVPSCVSSYVPGITVTVPPSATASTAAWIDSPGFTFMLFLGLPVGVGVAVAFGVGVVTRAAHAGSDASRRPLPSLSRPTVPSNPSWAALHGSVRLLFDRR